MVKVSELEDVVEFMRKHGVTHLKSGDLEVQLGAVTAPTPTRKPPSNEERQAAIEAEKRRVHATMFAASNVRPMIPEAKAR